MATLLDGRSMRWSLECKDCGKRYSKREHLQRHERIHTGSKPFPCLLCGRNFSRQDALNRHRKTHRNQFRHDKRQSASSSAVALPSPLEDNINRTGDSINPSPTQCTYTFSEMESTEPMLILEPELNMPHVESATPLSSTLFWPDSEDLLQNIMSMESVSWEESKTLMPPLWETPFSESTPFSLLPLGAIDSAKTTAQSQSDDGLHGVDSQHAIQTLKGVVDDSLSSVTAQAALSTLTSRFLDSCLHMFFTRFIPLFPIIHRPTFIFRDCSPPLLLNAIALGSLYLGNNDSIAKGEALWRLAHTAVATSWHTMVNQKRQYDSCSGVQLVLTALLSQIYASLAKNHTLRMISQAFHGLGIYWARSCGMFELLDTPDPPPLSQGSAIKDCAWKMWVARETQLRVLLGLYVVDGVISQFSGNPTFARHMSNSLPLPSNEAIFNASSADDWITVMRNSNRYQVRFCDLYNSLFATHTQQMSYQPQLTLLGHKVVLEGINSLVLEINFLNPPPVGVPSKNAIIEAMIQIRHLIVSNLTLPAMDKSAALLRWHAISMDLEANVARGTRRMCYQFGIKQHIFGGQRREEHNVDPMRWIQSEAARKSILHASEIHAIVSRLPLGSTHDIHLLGSVFAAATTYSAFALAGAFKVVLPAEVDWQTVLISDRGREENYSKSPVEKIRNTSAFLMGSIGASEEGVIVRNLLYELSSIRILLRGLSLQWGVASEMEEVVSEWIAQCG